MSVALVDPYTVPVWRQAARCSVALPGSKSLTNRALVLAALGRGRTVIEGILDSRDSRICVAGLEALGFAVAVDWARRRAEVVGGGGRIPVAQARLHVGNAGTAARFLTALVALGRGGRYEVDGDREMRVRPMGGLLDTLRAQGARIHHGGEQGCMPFSIESEGLRAGDWQVDASASSQMLSALLMVAPYCGGEVRIEAAGARKAFVEMTAALMRQAGVPVQVADGRYVIAPSEGYVFGENRYIVEPDLTAASYFMLLPRVVGGKVCIQNFPTESLQGDARFLGVVRAIGGRVELRNTVLEIQYEKPCPAEIDIDFELFSDTFLGLAAIAPLLGARIRMRGIGHTRHQETDRIHGMATELAALGVAVDESEAGLCIDAREFACARLVQVARPVSTYKDHRFAMAFGVLGSADVGAGRDWLQIADPGCCGKTFPEYFAVLERARVESTHK